MHFMPHHRSNVEPLTCAIQPRRESLLAVVLNHVKATVQCDENLLQPPMSVKTSTTGRLARYIVKIIYPPYLKRNMLWELDKGKVPTVIANFREWYQF